MHNALRLQKAIIDKGKGNECVVCIYIYTMQETNNALTKMAMVQEKVQKSLCFAVLWLSLALSRAVFYCSDPLTVLLFALPLLYL